MEKIHPPELSETLITFKIDPVTEKLNLEQSLLYRYLQQFRDFVRGCHHQGMWEMRQELDGHITDMRRELGIMVQEGMLDLEEGFRARLEKMEELSTKTSATVEDLQTSVANNASTLQMQRQVPAPLKSFREDLIDDSEGSFELHAARTSMLSRSSRLEISPGGRSSVANVRSSVSLGGSSEGRRASSESGRPVLDESPSSTRRISAVPPNDGGLPPDVDPELLASMLHDFASGILHGSECVSKSDILHFVTKDELETSINDMDKQHRHISEKLVASRRDMLQVEERLESVETRQVESLNRIEELAKLTKQKAEALAVQHVESDVVALAQRARSIEDDLMRLMREKTEDPKLAEAQREIADVRRIAEEGIASASLVPRIERLEHDMQASRQSVGECGRRLDVSDGYAKGLVLRLDQQGKRLEEADAMLETSLRSRCEALSTKTRAMDRLVSDAQAKVLQLSTVVRDLAQKGQVAELQEAVSAMTRDLRGKDENVLFGARCLSCNREYDDVQKTAGAVDLNGERQKSRLFAEVQRALHAPATDPTKQVKMIAVKVGRPAHVAGRGGTFEGRNASPFACGIEDIQLVPSVRRPPDRPRSTPLSGTPRRRLMKGEDAPAFVPSGARDGPLDFKKPLSHLVGREDRCSPSIGDKVLTAAAASDLTQPLAEPCRQTSPAGDLSVATVESP